MMRILLVGDWRWPQYEEAFASGLREHGVTVDALETRRFFRGQTGRLERNLSLLGPRSLTFNLSLLKVANRRKYDLILLWRVTELHPLVAKLVSRRVTLVSYNNDDPFGPEAHGLAPWHHRFLWRWYLAYLRFCHLNFFYRPVNLLEALEVGSKENALLMPYFIPEKDHPVELEHSELAVFESDVAFVGHFEDDGRDDMLAGLIKAGHRVKLWGSSGWEGSSNSLIRQSFPLVRQALGGDYAKAISGSKVSLAFLSKLNRDTYTRRCFEIPAMGGLLLAERTDDLLDLFEEDQEACFFSGKDELLEKVSWLLSHPAERERIATAGRAKVWAKGHHVQGRALEFLDTIYRYQSQNSRRDL